MAVTGHQGWEPGQRLIGKDAGKVMNLAVEPTRGAQGRAEIEGQDGWPRAERNAGR